MLKQLAARKSVAAMTREIESGPKLNRVLDRRALTSVGLGSMIGSGIFVLTGTVAAQHTGPAVTLAFLVAAIGCGLAALCYAELASMIPISGSAYSYTYATLGEGVAWFVGWNLALEYVMSGAAVAVGWSGYVVNLLAEFGLHLPDALTNAPLGKGAGQPPGDDGRPGQRAGRADRRAAHLGLLRRREAVDTRQQRDGDHQDPDHHPVHRGRHQVRHTRPLAALPSRQYGHLGTFRLQRRHAGRRDHLLRLHRLRPGRDDGAGSPQSAARRAVGHHRGTAHLDGALCR